MGTLFGSSARFSTITCFIASVAKSMASSSVLSLPSCPASHGSFAIVLHHASGFLDHRSSSAYRYHRLHPPPSPLFSPPPRSRTSLRVLSHRLSMEPEPVVEVKGGATTIEGRRGTGCMEDQKRETHDIGTGQKRDRDDDEEVDLAEEDEDDDDEGMHAC